MKSNLALINSIGLQNDAQKAWLTANMLESCLVSSPAIPLVTAVTAVIGKRAIPAYTGFLAVAAKTSLQNTTGYAVGEIFSGRTAVAAVPPSDGYAAVVAIPALPPSPAFAIGVIVPAYPAVPARAAQVLVLPVTAVAAVTIPAVAALVGYEGMVELTKTATNCKIVAYLPYNDSPRLYGKSVKGVSNVQEITNTAIIADKWFDEKASTTPTTLATIQPTIERMFYEAALALVATDSANTIEEVHVTANGKKLSAHKITLNLPATGYDVTDESIQLGKLGALIIAP